MERLPVGGWTWAAVLTCVLLSTTADALSVRCWKNPSWPLGLLVAGLAPLVFLAFGYVGSRHGLSVASSLTNSLIVVGPILVGLVAFAEWKTLTAPHYAGMALIVAGITVIAFAR